LLLLQPLHGATPSFTLLTQEPKGRALVGLVIPQVWPEVITMLLEADKDVNARDNSCETALMMAVRDNENPLVITHS
jgi:hypothetical protein